MATKPTTAAAQEAATAPRPASSNAGAVNKLELPHGIAARGKIVHIPEDVYKVHADAGKVTFIDYVRS